MTMEDWALAKDLRLARQLKRAVEIYIARTTDITCWAHGEAERLTVRPPQHLEKLERALLENLPRRAVLWGASETIEAHQRRMGEIIEKLSKEDSQ